MSNNALLIIIIFILLGIGGILYVQTTERTPAEKIGDSVTEITQEIQDEIDDHT